MSCYQQGWEACLLGSESTLIGLKSKKSISNGVQYVTLTALEILPEVIAVKSSGFAPNNSCNPEKLQSFQSLEHQSNHIYSLFLVSWLTRYIAWLIGPGGLLLLVSHLFAIPILVLQVKLGKTWVTKKNLDVRNNFFFKGTYTHWVSTIGDSLMTYTTPPH